MTEAGRSDLLAEIGTEELPPQGPREPLRSIRVPRFETGSHGPGSAAARSSPSRPPRRLALIARSVPDRVAGRTRERRGPALAAAFDGDGRPTRAALGFARSCGVDVGDLDRLATPKGTWLVHRAEEPPRPASDLVPGVIEAALAEVPIARRMRWGDGDAQFVRPVHWLVLLLGREIVEATILGVRSGRETRGPPFPSSAPDPHRRPPPSTWRSSAAPAA